MEPVPPPITIVNPHAPVGGGEVLDAEPWRPDERQQVVGLAVAAAVLIVGALGAAADIARKERAAERAAVAALAFATDAAPDIGTVPSGIVRVAVRNDGPDAVRLLSARLVPGGYPQVQLERQVEPGSQVTLGFPDDVPCEPLFAAPPEAVQLQVRTSEGTVVTRELPLSPSAYGDINHSSKQRCGFLGPADAFGFALASVDLEGTTVAVEALAFNDSVLPLTLDRLIEAPGLSLTVSRALPLALPPQPVAGALVTSVPVTLRLRVVSCDVFVGTLGLRESRSSARVVIGWVGRDSSLSEVAVLDAHPSRSFRPSADPSAVLSLLLSTCPSVDF